ncbi:J domain-containing protein [Oculatella sp. LEGE 06141]|uniref:J domain-containing protein n=1 Tax=Oculatella sp. LEGE 06141 TaxID=1828648 RepID=UPI00187E2267|nr:J domain-containing protein [Oculatella sp. LEGE 06141]MBE9179704.1 J domain-containing protein [Oculatella sp. LEGE 06141]
MSAVKLQYPHILPPGALRTTKSEPTKTQVSLARAADDLIYELTLLQATDIVISCDVQPLNGFIGYPEDYKQPIDPSAAISFKLKGVEYAFTCSVWDTVTGNMRDIGLAIAQKRSIRQRRCTTLEKEFVGYRAKKAFIPKPGAARSLPWWRVLYVSPDAPLTVIEAAYRSLSRDYHPDQGGSHEAMAELNRAYSEAKVAKTE